MGTFKITLDDTDTKAIRKVEGRRFHCIELTDLVDACGENDADQMGGKFNVELREVDLDTMPDQQINSALRSCGWILTDGQITNEYDGSEVGTIKQTDEILAECCADYGCAAPLFSNIGNNRGKLYCEARAESYRLSKNNEAYEAQMNRPVNALGSTAREYGQGDLNSALVRGIQNDNPNAKIMAKMYGASEETIQQVATAPVSQGFACKANLHKAPSTDPLAYMMGYLDAMAGRGKPVTTDDDEIAPEYFNGYKTGVAVKAGDMQKPEWIK